jgi:hypothetical protein
MDLSPIYILFNGKIWEDDHKLYGMEWEYPLWKDKLIFGWWYSQLMIYPNLTFVDSNRGIGIEATTRRV